MKSDATMYVAQKALIEKDGGVLVLVDPIEGLDFPGGKIQEGEDSVLSLEREVREEVGIEIQIGKPFYTRVNVFPPGHEFAGKQVFVVAYVCTYVSGEVMLSQEHTSFRWITRENYQTVNDGSWFFSILKEYFAQ